MLIYKPESLELLRQRIDLTEVVSSHIQLQRSGSAYKALCPFHEEKSPSFMISKGDKHYHCFGCGAHGDAIAFLMGYLKISFVDAIESLAERFQVTLEKIENGEVATGPSKKELRQVIDRACQLYHELLLTSEEAAPFRTYLRERGIDRSFAVAFQVGFAPGSGSYLYQTLRQEGYSEDILRESGLILQGRAKDFFSDRIMFPIRDGIGAVIGFSGRKIKEETFGGKYINTPETPLFKKSQVLFGLSYSRQRIAKERKAIVVEGQIDALRLIHSGFNYTIAGQGTAFGEGHVRELSQLGVSHVYLALDGDGAGREATVKIGDLFQKKGIGVSVISLPQGQDPDQFIKQQGVQAFSALLERGVNYLTYLVGYFSAKFDLSNPAGKNELAQTIAKRIRAWEHPLMVFESLRQLAALLHIPESLLGLNTATSQPYLKRSARVAFDVVDADKILETDLLRLLFLAGENVPRLLEIARLNLSEKHFRVSVCSKLYVSYMRAFVENKERDFLSLASRAGHIEEQEFLSEILAKKINLHKAEATMVLTVKRLLEREWMGQRDQITAKLQSTVGNEEEQLVLIKQFDALKNSPTVVLPPEL